MQLLVDSGGTKASWAFCRDGQEILRLKTEGLHPLFMSDEQINAILMQVRAQSPQSPEASSTTVRAAKPMPCRSDWYN